MVPKNSSVVVKIRPPRAGSIVAKGPAGAAAGVQGAAGGMLIPGLGGAPAAVGAGSGMGGGEFVQGNQRCDAAPGDDMLRVL